MRIELPKKVETIIEGLEESGFEAFAVGGCVRDSILGKIPQDWDIATSATPYEVKEIFRRTIDTGLAHGTVTVMLEGEGYEVTAYRIDGEYEDCRHPKEVIFTKSLKEDLKRRDFTVNAMAYNHKDGLVDLFGGIGDMKEGIIRCVGSAKERFDEDALRILRAVRFSAQLNFSIEEQTLLAARKGVNKLSFISAERIRTELNKLLLSQHPERLITAYEAGITRVVLPEFDVMMQTGQENPHHVYSVGIHSIKMAEWMVRESEEYECLAEKERQIMVWTALLHDVAKPACKTKDKDGTAHFYGHDELGSKNAKEILRRLKFDNETIEIVTRLILHHDYRYEKRKYGCSQTGLRIAVHLIGKDIIKLLFLLQEADLRCQNPKEIEGKLTIIKEAKRSYEEVVFKEQCVGLKTLAVNGTDLIEGGLLPGKELGEILNQLLSHVLIYPEDNRKEVLLSKAKEVKNIRKKRDGQTPSSP